MKTSVSKKKIAFVIVALALIAFRLYLPTLVLNYVNKELNRDPEYRGSVSDIYLHLWRGAVTVEVLKIEHVRDQKEYPLLSVDKIDGGISWRDLFRGAVVAQATIEQPLINFVAEKPAADQQEEDPKDKPKKIVKIGGSSPQERKEEVATWQDVFKKLSPLDVNLIQVHNGSIHFRDLTSTPKLNVYLDKIEVVGENLTNSLKLSKSLFGKIDINALVMHSGLLHVTVAVNPTVKPLETKVTLRLLHLDLTNLNELFTAYAKFDVKKGEFSLYSEVAVADNKLKGYVKPLIHDLQVSDLKQDLKKGPWHSIWEKIVGIVGFLFKNHPKDQQAVEVHFEGNLKDPQVEVWDAIKTIFQNVFIQALPPGLNESIKITDVKK